ncbi:MAG: metal ABC transporter ATP-binding protein [Ilumatobacteraceae bacterium]
MSTAPAIDATDLVVGYGAERVVEGITLSLLPGEALALVGTNGSGKSTLLKTLLGLIPAIGGSLQVLQGSPGSRPKRIAYLRQAHGGRFVVPIRAIEVVRMGRFAALGLTGRRSAHDRQLVFDALTHMEITDLAEQPLHSLSGGQQQRVYLAQVLAHEADLLVLDEPTAGLDMGGRERYLALVDAARARGAAVVTATHDIGEAAACDQVLLLNRRIVAQGPPNEVLQAERLLETFGITLQGVEHGTHSDFIIGEHPHGHDHPH